MRYVSKPPENLTFSDDNYDFDEDNKQQGRESVEYGPTFETGCSSSQLNLLTKGYLNDVVRDLKLCKKEAELLGSRLRESNLLHKVMKYISFTIVKNEFEELFPQENNLVFCNDVCCVIEPLEHQHDPTEWRLFIDS
jgi:hypothetical protein